MRIWWELKQYWDLITEIEAFQLTGMKNRDNFNLTYNEYLVKHENGDPQSYLESFHDALVVQTWTTVNKLIKGVLSHANRAVVQRLVGNNLVIPIKIEIETQAKIFKILESEIGTLFQLNYPPKPIR